MLLELGPVAAADVQCWSRLARRLLIELRANPQDLEGIANEDLLGAWSQLISQFDGVCIDSPDFRWSHDLDDDQAEFLLHGLERCLCSQSIGRLVTPEEAEQHAGFTLHLVEALVSGLVVEGRHCEHYVDEARAALHHTVD